MLGSQAFLHAGKNNDVLAGYVGHARVRERSPRLLAIVLERRVD